MSFNIRSLGWDNIYQSELDSLERPELLPARIIEDGKLFRMQSAAGLFWGEISGKFRFDAAGKRGMPAIGDWVACTPLPGGDRAIVHHLFTRRSCLVRKAAGTSEQEQVLAANVDYALITTSANQDLSPRRLERYLTLVWGGGAVPVILVTKVDLVEDRTELMENLEQAAVGVEVIVISARTGEGMDELNTLLKPGKTIVLLGSSGVGKSTLTNHLLGKEKLKTQEVREGDDRGRHTTTARYLFPLPCGALLIDTPGMRELGLTDDGEGLAQTFEDVEELATQCRFDDCQHRTEPSCAVKAALASGELEKERWDSYEKLQKELAFEKRKTDKGFASSEKKKWKKATKTMKDFKKK